MGKINLEIGDSVRFAKTFAECDVYMFAGITGDLSPNHTNEEFCKTTPFKTRTVHGCLTFSLANTLSSMLAEKMQKTVLGIGFDKVRFLKPVNFGDTISAVMTVDNKDEERMRVYSKCVMCNQYGEVVLVCTGIIKVLDA